MADETNYDVLCGKYTISISAPENPPPRPTRTKAPPTRETPTQECWPSDMRGDHGPVDGEVVDERARKFCDRDKTISYGETQWDEAAPGGGPYMMFGATWDKSTCGKDHDPVSVLHPEGMDYCNNLIYQNWRQCDNGGAGGHILVGCVRYLFWAWEGMDHDFIDNPP